MPKTASAKTHSAHSKPSLALLTVGAVGVVFGDIGTSPLYAFREALREAAKDGLAATEVLGVLSLALWALILVVTIKYVLFLMRASNEGEGGVLSLMALAQRAAGTRTPAILALGAAGAALFYGDAIITPAISVLSAIEGSKSVPGVAAHVHTPQILAISVLILTALFLLQARGTERVARLFGPVTVLWFLVIGGLGLKSALGHPQVLLALNPSYAVSFLVEHEIVGLIVLGAVFLTVTGAEALTADMGHFGRVPIQAAWFLLVFPALLLNYFGQAALALDALAIANASGAAFQAQDWFFMLAPEQYRIGLVVLAAIATVIASQAVITGAFSLTQQAIQLGLLPRFEVRRTSASHAGQIYVPQVNWLLFAGVLLTGMAFRSSSSLAAAYGISVTGTMVVTTCLAFMVARGVWRWPLWLTFVAITPFLLLDLTFFGANFLKVLSGGWAPLLLAVGLCIIMYTWVKGSQIVAGTTHSTGLALADLLPRLEPRQPLKAPGTAIFLAADPTRAPVALLHNLKHNHVLHEQNVILTVRAGTEPHVDDSARIRVEELAAGFRLVTLRYGYMESPDIPRELARCKADGIDVDPIKTSFFLSRRIIVPSADSGMPLWQDHLFIFLTRNATEPTTFFRLPIDRVVELGTQMSV